MNISNDLGLPEIRLARPRCEPDYYGASDLIASKLGVSIPPPISNASWLHGWRFQKLRMVEELILAFAIHSKWHLTANRQQENFLKQNGIKNAASVGMPFTYAIEESYWDKRTPLKNSLLVMPPHSLPTLDVQLEESKYVEFVLKNVTAGAFVCFCLHQNCESSGKWVNTLAKYNIPYVTGARIEDRNGLWRMAKIYSNFESMTTNSFGSHVIQAALCGLRVSVCGPFYNYDFRSVLKTNGWIYNRKQVQAYINLVEGGNIDILKTQYPQFFVSIPEAKSHLEWAKKESGFDQKIDLEALRHLLGWDHHLRNWIDYHSLRYIRIANKEIRRTIFRLENRYKGDSSSI